MPPRAGEEAIDDKVSVLSQQRFELIKKIIALDIEKGNIRCKDVDAIAFSYFSMIQGLLSTRIIFETEDISNHYESIWQIFWNGIN